MHIKQITISNFRSFRQQPEVHPFSSAANAVVGRNGSGKSNLFDAVQFVLLSPKFYTLRTEERQALLHEGSGSAAVNAFVEIVFDNSDNRFSLENSDEVVLRRTVGHKKDEFFLQRKRAHKSEIMSLLEGAGFSKSNPYFIVQQGKVNALCTMSDGERLTLLKEVAGTTVYDEKKSASLSKMEENRSSIDKIDEILSYIETRLTELRGEKEELTRYQKLDRERRAMAYTLHDKELRRARETLDEIEHARSDEIEALSQLHEEARVTHDSIRAVEATMKAKTNALRRNKVLMAGMDTDKMAAMTHRTKLQLECKELDEGVNMGVEIMAANKRKIQKLDQEISKARQMLDETIQPKFESAREEVARTTTEKDEARKKMEGIYAKQGRGQQFTTKEARDTHLQGQIQDLASATAEREREVGQKRDQLANFRRTTSSEIKDLEKKTADVAKKNETLKSLTYTIDEKKKERNDMAESRKEQWRALEEVTERVNDSREAARRSLSDMRKITPRATSMGLDALARIVEQEKIVVGQQYFGMLMHNFELEDEKFQTAVEVAAQNALFHVIVDTDSTAARLMKRLEKDKLGRVTFLPLNQLNVGNVNYPDSPDVTPMLSQCIRYDPKVQKAMQHVFGKKLLARSVDVASTWSSRSGMDAITMEGDLCSRKGALTGGFIDTSKSRLRAHAEQQSSEATLKKLQVEQREMQRKATSIDQQISSVMGEVQRLEAKQANLEHLINRTEDEIATTQSKIDNHKKQMETIEVETIPPIEVEIASLETQRERLQDEIGTELSTTLTEEDRLMLTRSKAIQTELETEIETQTQALEEVSVERQRLQSLLEDNLLRRRRELVEESSGGVDSSRRASRGGADNTVATQAKRKEDLEQRQRELDDAIRSATDLEEKLLEARKTDSDFRSELIASKNQHEKLKSKDMNNTRALEEAQESAERLLNKRTICMGKRELYMKKIQELGSLPPASELSTFTQLSISALTREIESVNKKLKKYSHVNKKAYDQFVNFSEQRESLLKRKQDLDKGADKVKELIESLDRQKDEAINRTFRGVSAHFKDVFKELVPNGAGELIMRTALDEGTSDDEEEETNTNENNPDVSMYRGIGIAVRFSPVGENYLMSQLSGGQKALVALALIFAIQRCDPAPFYLFDELDQALDSTYRAAVASLIQRQANSEENPTQFICSTFRPELVAVANRCYGISHQNKVSSIHHLSKKDALHFIANLMNKEEALGEVTSFATSRASKRTPAEADSSTPTGKRKSREGELEDDDDVDVDPLDEASTATPLVV